MKTALSSERVLPEAEDWRLWQAGQRVQIIKRDEEEKGGVLKLGTEVVSSLDGSIACLLGGFDRCADHADRVESRLPEIEKAR